MLINQIVLNYSYNIQNDLHYNSFILFCQNQAMLYASGDVANIYTNENFALSKQADSAEIKRKYNSF